MPPSLFTKASYHEVVSLVDDIGNDLLQWYWEVPRDGITILKTHVVTSSLDIIKILYTHIGVIEMAEKLGLIEMIKDKGPIYLQHESMKWYYKVK